ncbi:hypothetical protein Sste5346_008620 [Sporothrix stenoceras]|uniref:Rhodopsin domain-containing protein n=1 Tax=Sporothrix stenoceras TaxID=5173 RepID=A0ABR3YPG8_9PEZI
MSSSIVSSNATTVVTSATTMIEHTANLVLPSGDLGPSLRMATWVLVVLSGAFLVTRLYCKWRRHRALHLDDGFLVASWFMLIAAIVCTTVEISYGFGKHAATLAAESHNGSASDFVDRLNSISLTGQLAITFGICAQAWSKTSWAITLLRIASGRRLRGFMWFALVSMNIFFAGPAFGYWLQCTPVAKAWQPLLPGTCWNPKILLVVGIVASCYSGLMDLSFAIVPWLLLRHLQVSPAEKIGIAVAMSMGVFAAISAFIKASAMPSLASPDFSFDGVTLTLWSTAEPAVTIMAASVPMMRVLVQSVRKPASWGSSEEDPMPGATTEQTSTDNSATQLQQAAAAAGLPVREPVRSDLEQGIPLQTRPQQATQAST